ncbi:MAG: hypothetical protein WC683_04525 [bacterium]
MAEMVQYMKEGAAGIVALVIVLFLRPIVIAFIQELSDSRKERETMRVEFNGLLTNHLTHNTEVLVQVCSSLNELCKWVRSGLTGPTGATGATGATGEKGEKGD